MNEKTVLQCADSNPLTKSRGKKSRGNSVQRSLNRGIHERHQETVGLLNYPDYHELHFIKIGSY